LSSEYVAEVAAKGTALGFAFRTDRPRSAPLPRRGGGDGVERVVAAFDAVAERLAALATDLRTRGRLEQADLMETNGHIARDPDLRAEAIRRTEQGEPVGIAIRQAVSHCAGILESLDDPTLAGRAADVRQIGKRALAWLDCDTGDEPDGPLVLIAEEIGAVDLLEATSPIVGALSVTGGPNSHAAIVARSLSIPLLTGIDPALLELADGVEVLLDGATGRVRPAPPAAERDAALAEMAETRGRRATYQSERHLPCRTLDHHEVTLRANVATPTDARDGLEAGADGVGLLRTELPFLQATQWPTQTRHALALSPVLRELTGRSVTVRTLDFADDKLPPFLAAGREGQRLGRGLPLMLAEPDAFAQQFRAILAAASAGTDLRIMIPMVADLAELHACQRLLRTAAAEAGIDPPPLGVMIELVEAVERAHELAAAAAFVSIGSNDLTCQILGLDRRDPAATPEMTAHPNVLTAISKVVAAAHDHDRTVSVCGDAAAHPTVIPLLIGLGCDVLSVAPASVDEVRYRVRRLRYGQCRQLAADALQRHTAQQVAQLVAARGT
jgi:phosphoenolpyruvate-protein kinase (PTS system EI component)